MNKSKRHPVWWAVGALAAVAVVVWWLSRPAGVPGGFAASNGCIEVTEVDIAGKVARRVDIILVRGSQFAREGEVLAKTDTRVLQEQRLEAIARIKKAQSAVVAARALLEQRQGETRAAQLLADQRQTELDSIAERHTRFRSLTQREAISAQQLDDDRTVVKSARATLEPAKAQVLTSKAVVEAACTSIIRMQTRVEAVQATERRIAADIDDSELKVPYDGCVQYRVAEPGKMLAVGGRVLNTINLSDVYMTLFLPAEQVGTLKLGGEARLILDTAPDLRVPATINFTASVAQFTPKAVGTSGERLRLMLRVRARIPPGLSQQHLEYVKTRLPGVARVRVNEGLLWPDDLVVRLPQ